MRISMPTIPVASGSTLSQHITPTAAQAIDRLADFLIQGDSKTLVLTGAGISVDSGIRAYRGQHGSYTINKSHRPIFFHEFTASQEFRQRYWARSYLGYPPVRVAQANKSHFAIAALHRLGVFQNLITQNVDRLHHKAFHESDQANILELHGTLKSVVCLNCKATHDRDDMQDQLSALNPEWAEYAHQLEQTGKEPRQNPDGDVDLKNRSYDTFKVPECPNCGSGVLKPAVIFFGQNIDDEVKERGKRLVAEASQILVIGSSLATYSAYRLVKGIADKGQKVGSLNVGASRGDPLVSPNLRLDVECSPVLVQAAKQIGKRLGRDQDREFIRLVNSGIIKEVDTSGKKYPSS